MEVNMSVPFPVFSDTAVSALSKMGCSEGQPHRFMPATVTDLGKICNVC
jgi:hypothetical protein